MAHTENTDVNTFDPVEDIAPNYQLLMGLLVEVDPADAYAGDTELIPEKSNPLVAMAYKVAVNSHKGVNRKNGEPYINHPLRVAQLVKDYPSETISVALLHDTVEDTKLSIADLRLLFPESVCRSVEALTHADDEEYAVAIERVCKGSHDAMVVKLADTLDNSSESQLECFDEARRERKKAKYAKARKVILQVIENQNPLRDGISHELAIRGEVKAR